jgi:hypothetical protein
LVATAAPAGQPQPTFKVNVEAATIDVIPRTSSKQFVPDLEAQDFEVFEDGARQEILTMVLVHGGRVFNKQQPPPTIQAPAVEGLVLPTTRSADPAAGRIFVILIDDLHFTSTDTPLVRALLKKVAATLLHPGDVIHRDSIQLRPGPARRRHQQGRRTWNGLSRHHG